MSNECIFCQIASHKSPATLEFEDKDVVAFRDIDPKAPVHILIVPKKHLSSIEEVTPDVDVLIGKIIRTGRDIARNKGISDNGYRLVFNVGRHSGQIVDHIHLHILGGHPLGAMV